MNIEQLLTRLEEYERGITPRGDGEWLVQCPAHPDNNPSLSIKDTEDKILLYCFAGCQPVEICEALDLNIMSLFKDDDGAKSSSPSREVARYNYIDLVGNLKFTKIRYEPKRFKITPPGQDGLLYNLPAVAKAVRAGETIYVVEGEKDVDTATSYGMTATTMPYGAGRWPDYGTRSLDGAKRIVIVADQDEPGRKHAQTVLTALQEVCDDVTVVESAHGKDLHDHLTGGGTASDLIESKPPLPNVVPLDQFLAMGGERETLWGEGAVNLWASRESLMICGQTGAGKSTLAQQVIFARLGIGDSTVLGYPVKPASRCLYFALDRPYQIMRGMSRLCQSVAPEAMEELSQRFLVHHAPLPELVDTDPDLMSELAAEHGADMVVIDSLKDAAASMSDDVSGAAINAAVQALVRVADVMVLHHQRKGQDGRKPKGVDDIYGSRMISAGAGSAFVLWPKKPSEDDPLAKEQIELIHVKQAAEKIGPLVLNRDDKLGRFWMDTTVSTESLMMEGAEMTSTQIVEMLAANGITRSKQQVNRDLAGLVKQGRIEITEGTRGPYPATHKKTEI